MANSIMDTFSIEQRSRNMSAIKAKNTKPEIIVRKLLFRNGYRYRLHKKGIIGRPDIFLKKYNSAIFVHGCFWHQHEGCKRNFMPKSNLDYWEKKLKRNVERFAEVKKALQKENYTVVVIWECEIKNLEALKKRLTEAILLSTAGDVPPHHK